MCTLLHSHYTCVYRLGSRPRRRAAAAADALCAPCAILVRATRTLVSVDGRTHSPSCLMCNTSGCSHCTAARMSSTAGPSLGGQCSATDARAAASAASSCASTPTSQARRCFQSLGTCSSTADSSHGSRLTLPAGTQGGTLCLQLSVSWRTVRLCGEMRFTSADKGR